MKSYCHGGKLGDLVYGIPAARALGCGEFVLMPRFGPVGWHFSPRVVEPLLEAAGFRVAVLDGGGVRVAEPGWVDGNAFRGLRRQARVAGCRLPQVASGRAWGVGFRRWNIAEEHCLAAGVPVEGAAVPWLRVSPRRVAEVVIFRSARYRPWCCRVDFGEVARRAAGRCVFLGLRDEWESFELEWGVRVPWVQTRDLLEAAEVLAGADLACGNQTGLMAVSAGVGCGRVLERCERVDDSLVEQGTSDPRR